MIPSKNESEAKPLKIQVSIPGELVETTRRLAAEKGYGEDLGEFVAAAASAAIRAEARKTERKTKPKPEPKAEAKPTTPAPAPAKEPEPVKTGLSRMFS